VKELNAIESQFFSRGNLDALQRALRLAIARETGRSIARQSDDEMVSLMIVKYVELTNDMREPASTETLNRATTKAAVDIVKVNMGQALAFSRDLDASPPTNELPVSSRKDRSTEFR